MSEILSLRETIRRKSLEKKIDKNLKAFYKVGIALLQIRDERLYRDKYSSFEEYCQDRWGFTRARAHQLISASVVTENIESTEHTLFPANEAQVRPLTRLEPDKQIEAWNAAVETAPEGKVTAKHVSKVVSDITKHHIDEPSYHEEEELSDNQEEIIDVECETEYIDDGSNFNTEPERERVPDNFQEKMDFLEEFDRALSNLLKLIVKDRKSDWRIMSKETIDEWLRDWFKMYKKVIDQEKRVKQPERESVNLRDIYNHGR